MPTGVYQRSEKEKERLRKMVKVIAPDNTGKRCSVSTEFKKGSVPWNKGREWPEMSGENHPSRNPEHRAKFERLWKQPKGRLSGEKHPQWKGGITPVSMSVRNSEKYARWRKEVFERDGYKCVVCGDDRGGNLNAHHVKTFSKYPNERFNVSNGVTVCEDCHKVAEEAAKIRFILTNGG
jgi:hypothetical protein